MASGSYTHPPQVPPPTDWSAAQRRVSSGRSGSGARSGWGSRSIRRRAAASGVRRPSAVPTRSTDPSRRFRSTMISDQVAVADPPDRPAGEGFGADVADAGAGRDAREPGVGDDGDLLAERQMLEGRGDLVDLLHPGPERPATDQDQDVARAERVAPLPLDGGDGGGLAGEDPRRADLAVDPVGADHGRVDGGALDHRPFGGEVPPRKGHGAGQTSARARSGGRITSSGSTPSACGQAGAESGPAVGPGPGSSVDPASGPETVRTEVEQAEVAEVEHHLGDAAGQVGPDGRVVARPVGEDVDQARRPAVDLGPVLDRGPGETGGEGDGRDVEQQVRRAAERGVDRHGVADRRRA